MALIVAQQSSSCLDSWHGSAYQLARLSAWLSIAAGSAPSTAQRSGWLGSRRGYPGKQSGWLGTQPGSAKHLARLPAQLSIRFPRCSWVCFPTRSSDPPNLRSSGPLPLRSSGPRPRSQTGVMSCRRFSGPLPTTGPVIAHGASPYSRSSGPFPFCGSRVRSLNRRQMSCRRFSGPLPTAGPVMAHGASPNSRSSGPFPFAVLGSAPSIADRCHAGGSRVRSQRAAI